MNTYAQRTVYRGEPETRGDKAMIKQLTGILVVVMALATVSFAQATKEEPITDLNQFWNRTAWRIKNINRLVNLGNPNSDYERLIYEIEKFRSYIEQGEKNFAPENAAKKESFLGLTDSIKTVCDQMINMAYTKNKDELIGTTNELFRRYADLKVVLQPDPMDQYE